ncbi:uncharacterized protein LOC141619034 [Silene latifolia]|uniref:uncharacterized protein LOC141619034 n=1 Tax=Silene latifolia TaxID=37657 RepID=UPI003D77A978
MLGLSTIQVILKDVLHGTRGLQGIACARGDSTPRLIVFNGWLIMQRGLQTREKMEHLGICTIDSCVLCDQAVETHTHLFRSCSYSSQIITGIEQWLHLQFHHQNGYSKLQKAVCRMACMACWYYIWRERNTCRLNLALTLPAKKITDLKHCIRARLLQKISPRMPNRDKDWLQHLDIHL